MIQTKTLRGNRQRTLRAGLSLVEIMIVILIISLLATIAIPSFIRMRNSARNAALIADMRIASMAFSQHALQCGVFPTNAAPGVVPAGMEDFLERMAWTQVTPQGGNWDWEPDVVGFGHAVRIVPGDVSEDRMLEVDTKIDDGILESGAFQQLPDGSYAYLVE